MFNWYLKCFLSFHWGRFLRELSRRAVLSFLVENNFSKQNKKNFNFRHLGNFSEEKNVSKTIKGASFYIEDELYHRFFVTYHFSDVELKGKTQFSGQKLFLYVCSYGIDNVKFFQVSRLNLFVLTTSPFLKWVNYSQHVLHVISQRNHKNIKQPFKYSIKSFTPLFTIIFNDKLLRSQNTLFNSDFTILDINYYQIIFSVKLTASLLSLSKWHAQWSSSLIELSRLISV